MITIPETTPKKTFYNHVRKEGGSYVVSLPPEIIKHNKIKEGDEIAFQKEHSQKIENETDRENGNYTSIFNETVQSGERETEDK